MSLAQIWNPNLFRSYQMRATACYLPPNLIYANCACYTHLGFCRIFFDTVKSARPFGWACAPVRSQIFVDLRRSTEICDRETSKVDAFVRQVTRERDTVTLRRLETSQCHSVSLTCHSVTATCKCDTVSPRWSIFSKHKREKLSENVRSTVPGIHDVAVDYDL